MYSNKKNILQLVALLREFEIKHVVLCPGARNSPIVQTLVSCFDFKTYTIVDERSAAFFALGLIQELKCPVAICCTSGTALSNVGSAVAEAFYQQLPLLVISADRPSAWIGQMDGQTMPQGNIFGSLVKKSVELTEADTQENEWFCNRLINEALLALTHHGNGPVHINIPISDPLFNCTETTLPKPRKISRTEASDITINEHLLQEWKKRKRVMIIVGQQFANKEIENILIQLASQQAVLVLAEQLANLSENDNFIGNFDNLLYAESNQADLIPDLLITFGGHVVSKRIKTLLRNNHPQAHWHIAQDGQTPDLYQSMTHVFEASPLVMLQHLLKADRKTDASYQETWISLSKKTKETSAQFDNTAFSDLSVVSQFLQKMPENCALQLGNSSMVRNVQLFSLPQHTEIYCNRGMNGIDGSVSTAVGFASLHAGLTYLMVGDLSFFYDMNGLWNNHLSPRLRILLINNGGGQIFNQLPGLDQLSAVKQYVAATHQTSAKGWAMERDFQYSSAENELQLNEALKSFTNPTIENPMLLEVKTNSEINAQVFKAYYHHLK